MKQNRIEKRINQAFKIYGLDNKPQPIKDYFKTLIIEIYNKRVKEWWINKKLYKDNLELLNAIIREQLTFELANNLIDAERTTKEIQK